MSHISRERAAALGRETLDILHAGRYTSAGGRVVPVADLVRRAAEGTESYPPDRRLADTKAGDFQTVIGVANETTLAAARRLAGEGRRVAALNFASARHPGGGFLSGARAQEESLARSSGLYACLNGNSMYAFHQARKDALYTDYALYSPDAPVFRDDEDSLLDEPYPVSFITSPAPNAKVVLERDPSRRREVRDATWRRILKVLAIAAGHGHDTLVLGAWGCGAFGGDSREVAGLFKEALTHNFRGAFERVAFAVTDWSPERRFIGPFEAAFRQWVSLNGPCPMDCSTSAGVVILIHSRVVPV